MPSPPWIRHLVHTVAVALLLLALGTLSGCVVAGNFGNLQSEELQTVVGPATVEYERQSVILGTAFDFRVLRLVSALDLQVLNPTSSTEDLDPQANDQDYIERRLFRLDVPVLSVWDFESSGMAYPGLIKHRHTVDVWGRVGAASNNGEFDSFYGGAVGYYKANSFAISLTADYWTIPAEARVFQSETGGFSTVDGQAMGWVFGIEVTLFAGEHALDIAQSILDVDRRTRGRQDKLEPSGM